MKLEKLTWKNCSVSYLQKNTWKELQWYLQKKITGKRVISMSICKVTVKFINTAVKFVTKSKEPPYTNVAFIGYQFRVALIF